jgi:RNA polymerase sigma-70 factor, ECF subfamily
MPDQQLAQAAQNGNLEAFGKLIKSYEAKLKRYIMRISHFSEPEAEEILQEVFLKSWKNLNSYDSSLKFSNWIYRITHNETISSFRKHKSRGYDRTDSIDDSLFQLADDNIDFAKDLDRKHRSLEVRKSIQELPKKYKEVLVLRYFEDKSYDEISDILKKPAGTVATLINRAKKALKENLRKDAPSLTPYENQKHETRTQAGIQTSQNYFGASDRRENPSKIPFATPKEGISASQNYFGASDRRETSNKNYFGASDRKETQSTQLHDKSDNRETQSANPFGPSLKPIPKHSA